MKIGIVLSFAALLIVGECRPARAGWHEFWAEFDLHRRRVEAWPEPFVIPDRESVREPFRLMADNGWKQQNTLNEEWFDKDTNEIGHAGKIKLRQMLNEFPPHRRQIFVLEGKSQEITATRVASVCKYLAEIAPDQPSYAVLTTRIPGGTVAAGQQGASSRRALGSGPSAAGTSQFMAPSASGADGGSAAAAAPAGNQASAAGSGR